MAPNKVVDTIIPTKIRKKWFKLRVSFLHFSSFWMKIHSKLNKFRIEITRLLYLFRSQVLLEIQAILPEFHKSFLAEFFHKRTIWQYQKRNVIC